jgi:hypothetical protein
MFCLISPINCGRRSDTADTIVLLLSIFYYNIHVIPLLLFSVLCLEAFRKNCPFNPLKTEGILRKFQKVITV